MAPMVRPEARFNTLCCATIKFSSTVMPRNSRMFWKVRATRASRIDVVVVEPLQTKDLAARVGAAACIPSVGL